jgi:hypothetical protein
MMSCCVLADGSTIDLVVEALGDEGYTEWTVLHSGHPETSRSGTSPTMDTAIAAAEHAAQELSGGKIT